MFRKHVIKELSNYIDNQLSERDKSKVESHLKGCKICSDELTRLKTLSEKLKLWHAPNLEESFDGRVRNKIVTWELERGEVKMKKKSLAVLIPSTALVGILVLVFVGQLYVKRGFQGKLGEGAGGIGEGYVPYYTESKQFTMPMSNKVSRVMRNQMAAPADRITTYANSATAPRGLPYIDPYEAFPKVKARGEAESLGALQGQGSVIVIQPVIPATGEGEKIIRTGTVRLEVENGKETYKKASEICQELGGYLAASQFYKDREAREAGTITMRIPKDKFTTALDRLSALGKVENIGTDSKDVSQEYANLKAQLEAAMVVYNKTLEALQKRQTTIPEAMKLESE
jgi:hypothetical protein